MPIRNIDGSLIGRLAVLSERPIKEIDEPKSVMEIFAKRSEAELQRLEIQREMEDMLASLSEATRRLTDRQNALREANLAKTAILGTMVHDLRNPLATILSRSEIIETLIQKNTNNASLLHRVQKSCYSIVSMVERMDRQIEACLSQARNEATKLKIDLQEFPPMRTSDFAVALNAPAAAAKPIMMQYRSPTDLVVTADEHRLVEALDNLISNAIKYSNPG